MNRVLAFLPIIAMLVAACASGQAPATPPRFETGVDPEAWALVPAGEFLMGQHEALAFAACAKRASDR